MKDDKRKFKRFDINFKISSNEVEGKGINISKDGFGFLSDDEIIPADDIPFTAEVTLSGKNKRKFILKGIGRLLFSIKDLNYNNFYYNGIEFIHLDNESLHSIIDILKLIEK